MEHLLHDDFWRGLVVGLALGIMVAAAWDKSYELIRDALNERHNMNDDPRDGRRQQHPVSESFDEVWESSSRVWRWFRRQTPLAILLSITCMVMIFIGAFQVVSYSRMNNFIKCQADYNQQSALARDARVGINDKENDLLFIALRDNITAAKQLEQVPPAKRQKAADKLQDRLLREFHAAVKAHEHRLRSAKLHPYPPNPETTCGSY